MSDISSDMPDFDSMSPEEMMAWMETLAKRQGVDSSTLTTSADMTIADVNEDDERLKDMGEYIPHGWSKEKWEEHLAKEEAVKAAKSANQPPAMPAVTTPAPPPAAPPITAQADTASAEAEIGDMPDFDSMTPEETLKWMETLAKRQGADASQLMTSADASVASVSEDDERLQGMGDYVPYGWKKEDWDAHLAKEEAAKAAKSASQPPAIPAVSPPAAAPVAEQPDLTDMPTLEGFDFDTETETQPAASISAGATDNPMDWLSGLASDADDESEALANLSELTLEDPLAGLAALGGSDPLAGFDFGGDAQQNDPMDWLSGLATTTDDDNEDTIDLSAQATPDEGDADAVEWLESLSRRQGAPDEELTTAADLDIPMPTNLITDGPGYGDDYSFENPPNELQDSDNIPTLDFAEFEDELEDPSNWLDSLASGVSQSADDDDDDYDSDYDDDEDVNEESIMSALNQGADISPEQMQAFFEKQFDKAEQVVEEIDDDDIDPDAPILPADIPDWLQEQMNVTATVASDMDDEPVDEAVADEFLSALNLDDTVTEVPDWLESTEESAIDLDVSSQSADDGMPDWLTADMPQDEDISDIFDDTPAGISGIQELPVTVDDNADIDVNDPWVQALAIEQNADSVNEMETWYANSIENLASGGNTPAKATLQPADLPDDESLPIGTLRSVPSWLDATTTEEALPQVTESDFEADFEADLEVDDNEDGVPDWLSSDYSINSQDDMPDWLRDQVDDSVAEADDIPDWLADVDADVDVEDIPDWLRETMDDNDTDTVPAITDSTIDQVPTIPRSPVPATPAPTAITPAAKSPAPIARVAQNIDVTTTLEQARAHVSAGNIDAALVEYENIVRANAALDTVATDTGKLLEDKVHKHNPGVYRIYGDVLMRQGKLQEALDTYRRALNLL